MDIIGNFIIGIAIVVMLSSIRSIWKSNTEIRKMSKICKDIPEYRWLMEMGMEEQARHFNAYGIRQKNHYQHTRW